MQIEIYVIGYLIETQETSEKSKFGWLYDVFLFKKNRCV